MNKRSRFEARGAIGLGVCLTLLACGGAGNRQATIDEIDALLDGWHRAAATADEAIYLGLMTPDAVFIGTDASERWSKEEFAELVREYFGKGQGWKYRPTDRHVMLTGDGAWAWFDERLRNDKYGELRGTGVLRLTADGWRLVHYSMSFPVPNDVTLDVVEIIRAHERGAPPVDAGTR